jgi:hypothetical protein
LTVPAIGPFRPREQTERSFLVQRKAATQTPAVGDLAIASAQPSHVCATTPQYTSKCAKGVGGDACRVMLVSGYHPRGTHHDNHTRVWSRLGRETMPESGGPATDTNGVDLLLEALIRELGMQGETPPRPAARTGRAAPKAGAWDRRRRSYRWRWPRDRRAQLCATLLGIHSHCIGLVEANMKRARLSRLGGRGS